MTEKLRPVSVKLEEKVYTALRIASAKFDKSMQDIISAAIFKEITRLEKLK